VRIWLLKDGQANPAPQEAEVQTLAPGETRRFDNVLQQLFGLTDSASGALRLTSNVPILASSRTYDQPAGTDISNAKGLFFSAIPATFSAALGETAYLQGVSQGGSESFRYNYGLVETSGQEGPTLVRVTLRRLNAFEDHVAVVDYGFDVQATRFNYFKRPTLRMLKVDQSLTPVD
jgi:hypothetical protein